MKKCSKCQSDYPIQFAYCPIHGLMLIESGTFAPTHQAPGMSPTVPLGADPLARRKRNRRIIALVVAAVVVIFVIPLLAILALIAIPTFGSMKKHANEASAIQTMRAITQAEMQYEVMYPANGYACPLAVLGGDPKSGPPGPSASQLLQGNLTSGIKNGYGFTISECRQEFDTRLITSYKLTAVPQRVGKTGDRGFCSDPSGAILADPTGGANCTQPID
jgi:type IV pilus assembly protein PilA